MSKSWSAPTGFDEVCRRAAGRRRYHSVRRFLADLRRDKVTELIAQYGYIDWGIRASIARMLGVHRSTISRDIAAILYTRARCPVCDTIVEKERLKGLKLK
jgi:hypothetical protein